MLLIKSHLSSNPFWDLWYKWATAKPQVGEKLIPFLKITLSPRGWECVKSLQAIYFVPAKVLLGAGGKGIGVLGLCQAAELFLWTAEITLLIALKGK